MNTDKCYTPLHGAEKLIIPEGTYEIRINKSGIRYFSSAPKDLIEAIDAGRKFGNRPFIKWRDESYTYNEFFTKADKLSAALNHALKIMPGQRVAIAMRNRPEWMISFVACVQAGIVPVPINSWGVKEELIFAIQDIDAAAVICDSERYDSIGSELANTKVIVTDNVREYKNNVNLWNDLLTESNEHFIRARVSPDDDALILFTSGTTSRAKGVVTTHRSISQSLYALEYQGAHAAINSPDRIKPIVESQLQPTSLLCVPLFHVSGLHAQFLSGLRNGRRIVIMYKWEVIDALHLIRSEQCTQFNGVPVMVKQLISHPEFSSEHTDTLYALGLGGDAASPALLNKLLDLKPNAMLGSGYGLTESNGMGTAHSGDEFLLSPNSAGYPLPIVDLIVGETPLEPNDMGSEGPIWIRSISLMDRYWNRPNETKNTLKDGWLFTGDIGFLDTDGRLHITDRIKDIIIRGGENISSHEVEQCAEMHPKISDAAAFAIKNDDFGEIVGLAITTINELNSSELLSHMSQHLASYKLPHATWATNQPLPRNATGKLQKELIKKLCLEGKVLMKIV